MNYDFSVVIPIFNEEESVSELLRNIKDVFSKARKSFEIIFVDDGSTDKTLELLKEAEKSNRNIRIFSFRKNLGKSPALTLGFSKATGKFIVTMDADLQDDPANIPSLHSEMIKNDLDMITGWRKNRQDGVGKKISSKIFNNIVVRALFGLKLNDLNSGLKLYRAETAKELKIYGGMHRFIPIIVSELGYRVSESPAVHHPRKYGTSKYKFSKIFTDIPDLATIYFITKYNRRPLHFFGKVGSLVLFAGIVILTYLSYLHFTGHSIGDRPLLMLGVLLVIAGIQTVFTGLIADLIVNFHTKQEDDFPLKYQTK